jgi:hypothetical protein
MDRREFLTGSMGAAVLGSLEADSFAQDAPPPAARDWDAGQVRHLLPTVSDSSILIKASFAKPLSGTPVLRIGATEHENPVKARAIRLEIDEALETLEAPYFFTQGLRGDTAHHLWSAPERRLQ